MERVGVNSLVETKLSEKYRITKNFENSFLQKFRHWLDVIAVFLLVLLTAITASMFLHNYKGDVEFYQREFSPAVMQACGYGFVNIGGNRALDKFITRQTTTFDCQDITKQSIQITPLNQLQAGERYLMSTVAFFWKLLGVSWANILPVSLLLYSLSILAIYAIFRLGMSPAFAFVGACLIAFISHHLSFLPQLRDYCMAPFALWSVWFLCRLVLKPLDRKRFFLLVGCAGIVLGVGIGFRMDLEIYVPVFVITILFFTSRNILYFPDRIIAVLVFLGLYCLTGAPILVTLAKGSNAAHVIILGLMDSFTNNLGLKDSIYTLGNYYNDAYVSAIINSFSQRIIHNLSPVMLATKEYEQAGMAFLKQYAIYFPADIIERCYASIKSILMLPMIGGGVIHKLIGGCIRVSPIIVVFALMFYNLRWAIFLLGLIIFLGGYPSLQFDARHFFYLEFISIACILFLVQQIFTLIKARAPSRLLWQSFINNKRLVFQGAIFLLISNIVLLWMFYGVRLYQTSQLKGLFRGYLSAKTSPAQVIQHSLPGDKLFMEILLDTGGSLSPYTENTQYLKIDFVSACRTTNTPAPVNINFKYKSGTINNSVYDPSYATQISFIKDSILFFPIYNNRWATFAGIEVDKNQAGCIGEISQIVDLTRFPILLTVQLADNWQNQKLYQH